MILQKTQKIVAYNYFINSEAMGLGEEYSAISSLSIEWQDSLGFLEPMDSDMALLFPVSFLNCNQ